MNGNKGPLIVVAIGIIAALGYVKGVFAIPGVAPSASASPTVKAGGAFSWSVKGYPANSPVHVTIVSPSVIDLGSGVSTNSFGIARGSFTAGEGFNSGGSTQVQFTSGTTSKTTSTTVT